MKDNLVHLDQNGLLNVYFECILNIQNNSQLINPVLPYF